MRYLILAVTAALLAGAGLAISSFAASGSPRPEAVASSDGSATDAGAPAIYAHEASVPDSQEIPAAELAVILGSASDVERPLLEDGIVTRGELESSFLAAQQCTVSAGSAIGGVTVNEPVRGPDGLLAFGGSSSPDRAKLEAAGAAHIACVEHHYDNVSAGWRMESAYRSVQPIWDTIAACLRDKGYDAPAGSNWRQLGESVYRSGGDMDDFEACDAAANRAHSGN